MALSMITPEETKELLAILSAENTELRAENHALKVQRNMLIAKIEELTDEKQGLI